MQDKRVLIIFTIVAFLVGGVLYFIYPTPNKYEAPNPNGGKACTQEARACPDGSYVGRTGPNCEFAACPIPPGTMMEDGTIPDNGSGQPSGPTVPDKNVFCTTEAKLCPDGSYVGRVPPTCDFAKCP